VTTAILSADRMDVVIARLKQAVEGEGRQAYWVCPLVAESETRQGAAEVRHAELSRAFPEGTVGLVHGQMPPDERDRAMADFAAGRTRVLVATTVIEVGVDVPNASIMVIEGAEHFGLAQLHQLRGRVGRGAAASSCLLLYSGALGEAARQRLEIMRETEDGFRIAEVDLEMRGAGDLIGTMQSGLPRFRIADAGSQKALMEAAHDDARLLIERDPALQSTRGRAVRALLWLLDQDRAFRFISVG
jgi:ATP-dependent DNA helicase RecG